jgi:hypothetical protein
MVFTGLHPMAQANLISSGSISEAPTYLFWPVEGQGLLMRAFHIHPVVFRVRRDSLDFLMPFRATLDEEFVARITRYRGRIYVSPTSDEIAVCGMMEIGDRSHIFEPQRALTTTEVAIMAEAFAGVTHRQLATYSVRLQYADGDPETWQQAEAAAEKFIQNVLQQLNTPDSVLALESPHAHQARRQRQRTYKHWNTPEELAEFAQNMFDIDIDRLIVASYKHRVLLSILTSLHEIGLTRTVRQFLLPLLPKKASAAVHDAAYQAGISPIHHSLPSLDIELKMRLQDNIRLYDALRAFCRAYLFPKRKP